MRGDKSIIYWDSCIFYALLKNERHTIGQLEGIKEQIKLIEKNKMILVTSAITQVEVLEAKLPDETRNNFPKLFKRRNVKEVAADPRVLKLATEIRNHYIENPNPKIGFTVSVPDSIHLATAILYADVFYTLDENDKNNKKELGLLALDGDVAGHNLSICKPPTGTQLDLEF